MESEQHTDEAQGGAQGVWPGGVKGRHPSGHDLGSYCHNDAFQREEQADSSHQGP